MSRFIPWIALPAIAAAAALVIAPALGYTSPWSSTAAVAAGDAALQAGRPETAAREAMQAIALSPLDDRAIELLVRARDSQQRWKDEKTLLALADALTRRNLPLRFMTMAAQAERGDFAAAVRNVDLLLRQNAYEDALYAYLRKAAAFPDARDAIVRRLIASPRWRGAYIGTRALEPQDYADHMLVLAALAHGKAPPTAAEIAPFAQRLAETGNIDLARQLRHTFIPESRHAPLLDRRFARAGDNGAGLFGWALPHGVATWATGGEGLSLAYADNAKVAEQIVFLSPGRYRLTWKIRGMPNDGLDAVQWTLTCLDRDANIPFDLPQASDAGDGDRIVRQDVTIAGCDGQRLTLYYGGSSEAAAGSRLLSADLERL